jgi:hypothetical protein
MPEQLEPESYKPQKSGGGRFGRVPLRDLREQAASRRARIFRQDVTEWLAANSLGLDLSHVALHRYIPTELHIATIPDGTKTEILIATTFDKLLEAAGFEPFEHADPELGSFHQKRVERTKSRKTLKQLDDRVALLEAAMTTTLRAEGAEVNGLKQNQAESEAQRKAELKKLETEIEQANVEIERARAEKDKFEAETKKLKAETKKTNLENKKTLLELAHTFAKYLVKATAGITIAIGMLQITAPPQQHPQAAKPAIVFKIESHKIGSAEGKEVIGSLWLPGFERRESKKVEHDPLDSE